MGKPLAVGGDARRVQRAAKLGAGELTAAAERGLGSAHHAVVDPQVAPAAREGGPEPWRREGEEPTDVGGECEVPGGAEHMGAHDRPHVEEPVHIGGGGIACALPESPGGRRLVLRLHRAQPAHHLVRRTQGIAGQTLISEAPGGDVHHGNTMQMARGAGEAACLAGVRTA